MGIEWGDDTMDMNRTAEAVMTFGKYKGISVAKVIDMNPRYALWAHRNVSFFKLGASQIQDCVARSDCPPWLPKGGPDDNDGGESCYGGMSYADFGNN